MPYIYKISNDINDKLYIGKTSQTPGQRFREHCADSKRFFNRPLYAAMRKYGCDMFHIEIIEQCPNDDIASQREQYWIDYYKSFQFGYNATHGGDGKRLYDYELIYNEWLKDKNCKKVAERLSISPETVSVAVKEFGDIPYCKQGFAKSVLEVDMLDMQGNYIKTFSSIREAARFIVEEQNKNTSNIGGYSSHISSVCKGNRKSCLGYKWRYHN